MDKIVLITGATSGIGKATAYKFAENGYSLIITGRRKDRLDTLSAEIKDSFSVAVESLCFDVRNFEECQSAIKSLSEQWSKVDILINNAGLAKGFHSIHEGEIEDWHVMLDTNVKGLLHMTRCISPGMTKRESGHIINICSIAGTEVYPKGNVYCASKHAVNALTKSMRLDLCGYGVKVSQISPAHVEENEFALVRFDGDKNKASIYDDFNPLKSRDIAESIYFIANQPPHVNIQDILIMGTQQASANFIDRSGRKYD